MTIRRRPTRQSFKLEPALRALARRTNDLVAGFARLEARVRRLEDGLQDIRDQCRKLIQQAAREPGGGHRRGAVRESRRPGLRVASGLNGRAACPGDRPELRRIA